MIFDLAVKRYVFPSENVSVSATLFFRLRRSYIRLRRVIYGFRRVIFDLAVKRYVFPSENVSVSATLFSNQDGVFDVGVGFKPFGSGVDSALPHCIYHFTKAISKKSDVTYGASSDRLFLFFFWR